MSEQKNTKILQMAYECFGRGDIPSILKLLADDLEWVFPGPTDVVPWAGTCNHPEEVGQFFSKLSDALDIREFEPKSFIAQGDRVIVLGNEKATAKSTGRFFAMEWAHAWTIRDGKVASLQEYNDTDAIVSALRSP